jgi:hypothetical protein
VSSIAGNRLVGGGYADGFGTNAVINYIYFLAVSTTGKLYLADRGNNRIRVIDLAGMYI